MGEHDEKKMSSTHTLADAVKQARPDEVDQAIEMLRRHWQNPLKDELDEREKILDQKQADINELGEANKRLTDGIEAVRKENGDLRAKLHAAEKARDALEVDKGAATKAYEEAADQRDAANERVNELDLALKIANDRIAAVSAERDSFAKDVTDTAEKVAMQETVIEELRGDVEQTRARLTAANRTAAEAVQDRISRMNELHALRDTVDAVQDAVGKYRAKQDLLRDGQTDEPAVDVRASRPKTRTAPFEEKVVGGPGTRPPVMPTGRELGIVGEADISPASAMPTQEIPVASHAWPKLKERLDAEIGRFQAVPKQARSTDKLTATLVPLLKRYESGERTAELADAIDASCR